MRVTEIHSTGKPTIKTTVDGRITVVLPITVLRRSARKQIVGVAPNSLSETQSFKITSFQSALVRGHNWLAKLESGEAASLKDIAQREGIDASLVSRLINLTALAPEITGAILDDTLACKLTVLDVAIDPPLRWGYKSG